MDQQTLAFLRDLSVILLCLEAFILLLVPLVIVFFAQRYLRRFRHWLRLPLLRVQVYTLRVQHLAMRATDGVARVPIAMHMLGTQVEVTIRHLARNP